MTPTLDTACNALFESPRDAATFQPVQARAGGLGAAGFSPGGAPGALGRPGGA